MEVTVVLFHKGKGTLYISGQHWLDLLFVLALISTLCEYSTDHLACFPLILYVALKCVSICEWEGPTHPTQHIPSLVFGPSLRTRVLTSSLFSPGFPTMNRMDKHQNCTYPHEHNFYNYSILRDFQLPKQMFCLGCYLYCFLKQTLCKSFVCDGKTFSFINALLFLFYLPFWKILNYSISQTKMASSV